MGEWKSIETSLQSTIPVFLNRIPINVTRIPINVTSVPKTR